MIRIRAYGLVALALIAVGAIFGCAGGSDTPSQQDFARNADKICADVSKRVAALNRIRPKSVAELFRFIDQLKTTVNDGITRLQALKRPKGSAGKTALEFTDALDHEYKQQVLPALNQLQTAVSKRDKRALKAASQKLKAARNQKSDRLAAQLGAARCASR